MVQLSDSDQRAVISLKKVFINIGELSQVTGVSQVKLRYWTDQHYLERVACTQPYHSIHQYNLFSIFKVRLIVFYLNKGYTLKASATQAATQLDDLKQKYQALLSNCDLF